MQTTTRPAPASKTQDGACVPGTVGFDIYLATLGATAEALRAPKLPTLNKDKVT